MSKTWEVIAIVSVLSAALKASGPLIARRRAPRDRALDVIALMPAALLTAFVLVDTVSTGRHLVVDPRLAGLAAAALALALRANVLIAVVVAAAVTGAVRLLA
jgi:hypothetical protein